ncbi:spore coat protein [Bacillus thuringiensis serovar pingluonsis]|uniref:Spore coat protein n=1 Tax=Bacillus thuringiensis serovar pingluonsis TaxID=180881 RepID=A0A243AWD9_BACTU|nr:MULTISPECIES: N-acetylneuraminate synthase family protein [Bacillus cereus group]MEB9686265.1 N-acetylneuraminate synthase family protein [Bacillus anthracis]OTY33183.1 spore coat protein [Bacillus thuringiensis serovar pingluonsis]
MNQVKIIAEIANAHQGNEKYLKELIQAAADCGADGVKFQWFKYDHLAVPDYSYYKDYLKLFIDKKTWKNSVEMAKKLGLEVWVDIFDSWGIELLHSFKDLIDGIKLPSTVLQSNDLIKELKYFHKTILIGVGGWYDTEIDQMLSFIEKHLNNKFILMHGFQGYPTRTEDVNLKRIIYLKNRYNLEVGFADHEDADKPLAIELPSYAYFAGATVIEKHITLKRSDKGYDYYSSLEPHEFKRMVTKIRQSEVVMGQIEISNSERKYIENASLRLIANKEINKGEIIPIQKTTYKRCDNEKALMPLNAEKLLPQIAKNTIQFNEPITANMIEKPKITLVVICRLKSTRLAKKALLKINGIPSIKRCLLNCLAIPEVDNVVLATSHLSEDNPLEEFTMDGRVKIVRGDPDNVAERMIQAANLTDANIVIRVTGDCPAVSPELTSYLIQQHLKSGADFTQPKDNAIGINSDIITVEALHRLVQQSKQLMYTEYLSFYFINNPHLFSVNIVKTPSEFSYPTWRLTLDEQPDLDMFNELYKSLDVKAEPLLFQQIKDYIHQNPELIKINSHVKLKWANHQSLVDELNRETRL